MGVWVLIGLIVLLIIVSISLVLWAIKIYNRFKILENMVKKAWSDIDTLIRKRYDLIPNLVETVKGYAKHEQDTLVSVINARNAGIGTQNPKDAIDANNMFTSTLKSLFALAEAYPDLKANQNYMDLQEKLAAIETELAQVRQVYNQAVTDFNTAIMMIPQNFVASIFKFKEQPLFGITDEEREIMKDAPKVQF